MFDFNQHRFMQISEAHCGPAVIQMLLTRLGVEVTQEEIAEAGGATTLIEMNGMRVDQLAAAVHRLAPRTFFYVKDNATIAELVRVVNDYRTPAGVEWQGLFEGDDDEEIEAADPEEDEEEDLKLDDSESEDDDYGHYSLVVRAHRRKRQLIITDPYKDYFSQARLFGFAEFDARWYDYNEIPDPISGRPVLVKDDHLFFVVVSRSISFPHRLGMRLFPR
jgi:hypothetical protein